MDTSGALPLPSALVTGFAGQIVQWQRSHGRSSLPWQNTRDPYRVWLSEIMLQQTQVSTVLGYFERFLARFPDVRALASAHEDEVLALWSGLGYYSRARNMLRCAREVAVRFDGVFPGDAATLATLPGIGRSTAGAVAAFCFGERTAILDGNVKRVLTRVLAYGGDLSLAAHERTLWNAAARLLPAQSTDMPAYTQGLMDLGATVCTPRRPQCMLCPVNAACAAHAGGAQEGYPVKSRRLRRSAQSLWMLLACVDSGTPQQSRIWLEKRPASGIWAGLYCLPVFETREALEGSLTAAQGRSAVHGTPFLHVLTHKDLHLHPVTIQSRRMDEFRPKGGWFAPDEWRALGLPAPVRRLLEASQPGG